MTEDFKKYLDEKFEDLKDLINDLKKSTDTNTEDIQSNKENIIIIETKVKNHLDNHKSNNNNKRFNYEMIILIAIFAADKFLPG